MFDPCRKPTGTAYTPTVALLLLAFIFSPAVLFASRPFGYLSIFLALTCSALCVSLAWFSWKKSQPFISSIAVQDARGK